MAASHEEQTAAGRGWAPQHPVLEWADRLTRQVVEATGGLAAGLPPSQGRMLREAAVLVHAGAAAACRCADPGRARQALAAVDRGLRRLRLWIELAERFGDLPPESTRTMLQAQRRLHRALTVLAASPHDRARRRPPTSPAFANLALSVPPAGGRHA